MTLTLPDAKRLSDAILHEWHVVYGEYKRSSEELGWWLAGLTEEYGMDYRLSVIGQLAAAEYADYDALRNAEWLGRMWPRELREQYAEVPISVLRLCIKDGAAWLGFADWCQETHASYTQAIEERQRRAGKDPIAYNIAGLMTKVRKMLTGWSDARRHKAETALGMLQEALADE